MEQTLLLAPLAGAVIAALGWRLIGESAARWTATALILIAAGLGWLLALNASPNATVRYFQTWIESGSLSSAFAFRLDLVMAVPLALVISLSAIAHV
ncbi:MAG: NADH-quinone oxidoreductase subunit L, partial [Pseudomonadota bacterium]